MYEREIGNSARDRATDPNDELRARRVADELERGKDVWPLTSRAPADTHTHTHTSDGRGGGGNCSSDTHTHTHEPAAAAAPVREQIGAHARRRRSSGGNNRRHRKASVPFTAARLLTVRNRKVPRAVTTKVGYLLAAPRSIVL